MDIKSLSGIIQQSASDGKMSKDELKQLKYAVIQSPLPDNEKAAIIRLGEKITEFSKGGLFKKGNINPDEMAQLKAMEPDLQDSKFAREMLNLFEEHVQPEQEFSIFKIISNFFSNLFGRHSENDSVAINQDFPDTQVKNNTQNYQTTPINPTEINFNMGKPSNSEYPTEPEQNPIASIPDYEPTYFSSSPISGAEKLYERSPNHDEDKFVPAFAMAAFHESGIYRKPDDPYAVGAISKPSLRQDLGGKSY